MLQLDITWRSSWVILDPTAPLVELLLSVELAELLLVEVSLSDSDSASRRDRSGDSWRERNLGVRVNSAMGPSPGIKISIQILNGPNISISEGKLIS